MTKQGKERKGKARDPKREQQWRELLRGQQRSRLSIRAYCRSKGLSEPAFYFWRRELKLRQRRRAAAVPFVELQAPVSAPTPLALELRLPQGLRLRIQRGCDLQLVRELLAVLEERAC